MVKNSPRINGYKMKSGCVPAASDFVVSPPEETSVNNFVGILPNIFYAYIQHLSLSPFFPSSQRGVCII